ncbi:DNA translocase FtsK [Paenibacillus polymyxa]|uniref:DNA translocase FtsK n=1 Tax=Paenibacillus polymyxa TaxID=1406 RepID=UPI0008AAACB1|nr:DNA translocase FtsK [Paenibacillus polymyxa]SEI76607.1 Ftsk gamma domain-containing protein [Paenibacillus polymyxa]
MNIEKPERYEEALEVVKANRKASVTFLQRKMRIGYVWAARIIDRMEQEGLIGPYRGDKPREIHIK